MQLSRFTASTRTKENNVENQETLMRVVQFTKTDGKYTLSGIVEVAHDATEQQIEAAKKASFDAMVSRIKSGEQIGEM